MCVQKDHFKGPEARGVCSQQFYLPIMLDRMKHKSKWKLIFVVLDFLQEQAEFSTLFRLPTRTPCGQLLRFSARLIDLIPIQIQMFAKILSLCILIESIYYCGVDESLYMFGLEWSMLIHLIIWCEIWCFEMFECMCDSCRCWVIVSDFTARWRWSRERISALLDKATPSTVGHIPIHVHIQKFSVLHACFTVA